MSTYLFMPEELINKGENEEDVTAQLSYQQEMGQAARSLNALYKEGSAFGSPSLIKYYILCVLAGINDVVDLLDLTGFGAIIAWLVSIFLSASIILIFWLTNTKQKQAKHYVKNLKSRVTLIARRTAQLEQGALKTARVMGKIPGLAKTGAKLEQKIAGFGKKIRGSPTGKAIGGGALEFIPFLDILPWSLISVIWAYIDERRIYKDAKKAAKEVGD